MAKISITEHTSLQNIGLFSRGKNSLNSLWRLWKKYLVSCKRRFQFLNPKSKSLACFSDISKIIQNPLCQQMFLIWRADNLKYWKELIFSPFLFCICTIICTTTKFITNKCCLGRFWYRQLFITVCETSLIADDKSGYFTEYFLWGVISVVLVKEKQQSG